MKTKQILALAAVLVMPLFLQAQEDDTDRLSVPFSEPDKPGIVQIGLINGSITVTGYEGKVVEIESRVRMKKLKEKGETSKKTNGMFHIPSVSTELQVEEENNIMEIDIASHKLTMDVTVNVPVNTSLKLSTINNGDIQVSNVKGNLEANNINGDIRLNQISGSVVANTHNGDLIVTFASVDPEKAMSFSTFNHDVDVTFPADLKASVKLKTEQGDIYSDFEIVKTENQPRIIQEKAPETHGKYKVRIERAFYGTIHGGGPEMQFTSYNGDILIRKAK
ncbi:DUF4097 family beta strand repeat protein [bacterium]|nr:DUF4097 family beta strand repeat protein [bacterium]